jgi:glycosyltransferase involved in cell wall biosynthesis
MQSSEDWPLVSVVVLTYCRQERLFQTLSTVLEQDYPNMELLISDDAGGEQNPEAISDWLNRKAAGRFVRTVVRSNERNLGTVRHANLAAGLCEGEYLHFLPCGDGFCRPDALSSHVRFAERFSSLVTTSQAIVSNESFEREYYLFPSDRRAKLFSRKPGKLFRILCRNNIICAVATLFRREFFLQGGFDPAYRFLEDWPTWLRLTREGETIPCLNEVTAFYALSGISSEGGNAYSSPRLSEDMRLCHEKEIFPFIQRIPFWERTYLRYRYASLWEDERHLLFRYPGFVLYRKAVRFLKDKIVHR